MWWQQNLGSHTRLIGLVSCLWFLPLDCRLTRLHSAAAAVLQFLAGWVSITFVYCVETAKDMAIVAVECE